MNLLLALIVSSFIAFPAMAAPVTSAYTTVDLVSNHSGVTPGQEFYVGLHMNMEDDWHVYWQNPGDSGLPPRIQWTLPEGISIGDVMWPAPERLVEAGLATYAYENEVLLISPVVVADNLVDGEYIIEAKVSWLACKDVCVPGRANLSFPINVSTQEIPHDDWVAPFEETLESLPRAPTDWQLAAFDSGKTFTLVFVPNDVEADTFDAAYFYPDQAEIIDQAAEQTVTFQNGAYFLEIPKSTYLSEKPETLQGVVVSSQGAWIFSSYVTDESPIALVTTPERAGTNELTILAALLFAFIGGLILNLMPCVLPVLSIKVLSLVQHANDPKKAWLNGLVFTLGVLISFWLLAGLLIALRFAGQQIGWGFQFQSPVFLVFLSSLLFLFGLNLLGVYEVGTSLASVGSSQKSSGLKSSFFSGVLATIVATPCTAPFMGSALGFAISQPVYVSFLVFTALGLGMSSPYLILAKFPTLLKFVPKPGDWMITFKKALSFLLFTTVIWLLWVLGLQLGMNALIVMLLVFLLMSIAMWLYGLGNNLAKPNSTLKFIGLTLVVASFVGAVFYIKNVPAISYKLEAKSLSNGIQWQKFSPTLIDELTNKGAPVFLDFTAAWCLTCQVNERVALQKPSVIDAINEKGIVAVKADWTNHDPMITQALEAFGKNSIPLYVLYDREGNTHILPELITQDIVLDYFDKID